MLSDVVRRGLLGKFVEDILRQPRRKVFGHVTAVVWVGTGLLVRWATGKRLTNRLPKVSLIPPFVRALSRGYIVIRTECGT